MLSFRTLLPAFALGAVAALCTRAHAQTFVIAPGALANLEGNASGSPLGGSQNRQRILQYIPATVNGNVEGLNVGDRITALAFRLNNPAQPNSDFFTDDFEIYMGRGAATASATFLSNYAGGSRTLVRDGALAVAAGAFPDLVPGNGPTPEAFSNPFTFGTFDAAGGALTGIDYIYEGGALVYELSYNLPTSLLEIDAATSGQATGFSIVGSSNRTATTGTLNSNSVYVTRFTVGTVVNAPEPASLALLLPLVGAVAASRRRNASR
jgi:hypothetical protein